MQYKVGMFGGSFDPLHIGHLHVIIRAASMCDELYVAISWSKERDNISKELRYRWILNSCKHLSNVKILLIEDDAISKEEYNTEHYWKQGAEDIKKTIRKPIDAVFCGSDYQGTGRFESYYDCDIAYFDRKEIPISSTDIRQWAYRNWDYIPDVCKDYYTYKVLIVGGESTGKSTLVRNLALAYNTNYVSEVGRDTCEYAGGEDLMIAEDLFENLLRQKINVMDAVKKSNRMLFVDTDALTTLFYGNLLLDGNKQESYDCSYLAASIQRIDSWDLVLFLEPDVDFVQDGTRNEKIKNDRIKYSNKIKNLLDMFHVNYHCISGDYTQRFDKAKELINANTKLEVRV